MKNRKPLLIAGIIITAVVIVVFLGAIFLGNYIEDKLQDQKFGSYHIQNSEASVSIFLRQITIKDAVVEDSEANQRFTAPEIKASGIRIFPYLFNDELIINRLHIQQPEVTVSQGKAGERTQEKEETAPEQDRETERIIIKELEIADAAVLIQEQNSGDADTLLSLQGGIEIRNLNIFSDNQQLKFDNHSAEKLELNLSNGIYHLPGGLYTLKIGSFNFNTENESLSLEDLHFSSLYSKYEIAGQTGVETDWYDIALKQLKIEGININTLLEDTAVVFQTAVLEKIDAAIFRDKRPPFPDKPDSKLPMEMLQSLPISIHSDSILLKNGTVVYEEHVEEGSEPGKVSFNRLYASLYNMSTLKESIAGRTVMDVRAMIMGEALFKVKFVFPNKQYSNQYQASGNMEPINASAFNPMLIPTGFVRVEEGQIKRLEFDFTYNNDKSEGNLALEYDNLDIALLDKEDGSQKTIKTFLTETFVLQNDNLQEDNNYQEGTISFEREKKKSIFNYWWKSIFSGIKDILAF